MGLRIHSTVAARATQRALERVSQDLSASYRRLSTGLRITTAADDAAGLSASERLRAKIRSVDQSQRNAQDAISLVQTAEGALDEVGGILTRLRELAVQSANATTTASDQSTLNSEFQTLVSEINRLARASDYGGIKLLDGSVTSLTFQIGPNTTANVDTLQVTLVVSLSTSLNLNTLDIGTGGNTSFAINQVDTAINTVSQLRGRLGAVQNRLTSTIAVLGTTSDNYAQAESRIRDADLAYETAQLTRHSIVQQAAIAVLAQVNAQPNHVLRLLDD